MNYRALRCSNPLRTARSPSPRTLGRSSPLRTTRSSSNWALTSSWPLQTTKSFDHHGHVASLRLLTLRFRSLIFSFFVIRIFFVHFSNLAIFLEPASALRLCTTSSFSSSRWIFLGFLSGFLGLVSRRSLLWKALPTITAQMACLATMLALLRLRTISCDVPWLTTIETILVAFRGVLNSMSFPFKAPRSPASHVVFRHSLPKMRYIVDTNNQLAMLCNFFWQIPKIQQKLIPFWNTQIQKSPINQRSFQHVMIAFDLGLHFSQGIHDAIHCRLLHCESQNKFSVMQCLAPAKQRKLPSDQSQKFKAIGIMKSLGSNLIPDHVFDLAIPRKTLLH